MTTYLLDSNVFIQAKNLHYGFDFVPAFWDWLVRQNKAGGVASIERVLDELRAGGDELSEWTEEMGDDFFLRADAEVAASLALVSEWGKQRELRRRGRRHVPPSSGLLARRSRSRARLRGRYSRSPRRFG